MASLTAFVFWMLLLTSLTLADVRSDRVVEQKEGIIKSVAREAAVLYTNRASAIEKCTCSTHTCSFVSFVRDCHKELGGAKICGRECKTQKLNYRSSVINTPPGTDPENLSDELKASICTYRGLEDHLRSFYPEVTHWTYLATPDGHFRLYPAVAREHNQASNRLLKNCREFDPRKRPWYIAASSAPKDIVFLIDGSKSMTESDGNRPGVPKWNVARSMILAMLQTLTGKDYINIVLFKDQTKTLWSGSPLIPATTKNKAVLKAALLKTAPGGDTDFDGAFNKAFELLSDACKKKKACSGCQQVIMFITDGRDTSKGDCRSIKPSNMAKAISRHQSVLKDVNGGEASIFTVTVGQNSDDGLPRQIACANNGAWTSIEFGDDPLTAMTTFYRFMAAGRGSRGAIWTAPYIDDLGLGLITTVARPLYAPSTNGFDGIFLGVTGHDVALSSFGVQQKEAIEIVADLVRRSSGCDSVALDSCQRQLLRHSQSHKATCIDRFPINEADIVSPCYTDGKMYYQRVALPVDWDTARARCEGDGGKLATIENEAQLAFLASMAADDGCWIGARRSGASFYWLLSSARGMSGGSNYWGNGGVDFGRGVSDCVAIDNRGPIGNLKTAECHEQLTFICAFETDKHCNKRVLSPTDRVLGYYSMPSSKICKKGDKHLKSIGKDAGVTKVKSRSVVCPLGKPKKDTALRCCGQCSA